MRNFIKSNFKYLFYVFVASPPLALFFVYGILDAEDQTILNTGYDGLILWGITMSVLWGSIYLLTWLVENKRE